MPYYLNSIINMRMYSRNAYLHSFPNHTEHQYENQESIATRAYTHACRGTIPCKLTDHYAK